jgi:hypothetical protein
MRGGATVIGRSAAAKDATLAARLWKLSQQATGVAAGVGKAR